MMTMRLTTALLITGAVALAVPQAGSWPQFGGPNGDFKLPAAPLASEWTDGPAVGWSRELGEGFSGIAVSGNRLFTMYRRGDDEVVAAIEAATGRTLWEHALAAPRHEKQDFSQGPGPHATPLVTGDIVCAAGATGRLRCLQASDGRLLWSRDLVTDDGATVVSRGYSSSPIAYGEAVIVQAGGTGHALIAFDRRAGRQLWASGDHANTNASPTLFEVDGQQQVVAFMVDVVAGFDPETGRQLWSHPHPQRFDDNIAKPIAVDDTVIVTSALDGGTRALRIRRDGTGWRAEQRWFQPRAGAYYTNAAVAGDVVLLSSGGMGPTFFSALRLESGEIAWQTRDVPRSQILVVGDDLLLRDESGGLVLATLGPSGVGVRARGAVLAPGAPSPPSLVGTTLYARDRERIVALDLGRN